MENLKCGSLMIGDWVKLSKGNWSKIVQVGLTDIEMIAESVYLAEPIPLTPEILEKIGFIKDENEGANGTTYHTLIPTGYDANSYTIQITLYKEPICGVSVLLKIWGWVPPYNAGTNDIHLCSVNYVHELQHALKLCGIEKEITL